MSGREKRRSSAVSSPAAPPSRAREASSPSGRRRQATARCRQGGASWSRRFRSATASGSETFSSSSSASTQGRPAASRARSSRAVRGMRVAEPGSSGGQPGEQVEAGRLEGERDAGVERGGPVLGGERHPGHRHAAGGGASAGLGEQGGLAEPAGGHEYRCGTPHGVGAPRQCGPVAVVGGGRRHREAMPRRPVRRRRGGVVVGVAGAVRGRGGRGYDGLPARRTGRCNRGRGRRRGKVNFSASALSKKVCVNKRFRPISNSMGRAPHAFSSSR